LRRAVPPVLGTRLLTLTPAIAWVTRFRFPLPCRWPQKPPASARTPFEVIAGGCVMALPVGLTLLMTRDGL